MSARHKEVVALPDVWWELEKQPHRVNLIEANDNRPVPVIPCWLLKLVTTSFGVGTVAAFLWWFPHNLLSRTVDLCLVGAFLTTSLMLVATVTEQRQGPIRREHIILDPLKVALLQRLPATLSDNPDILFRVLDTLVAADTSEQVRLRKQRLTKLLEDDTIADEMMEIVTTVAVTKNQNTIDSARGAVDALWSALDSREQLRAAKEAEHEQLRQRVEADELRQLEQVQPDFSEYVENAAKRGVEMLTTTT